MIERSENPVADYERYEHKQYMDDQKLPLCGCCGERIRQEKALCINGLWVCDSCINEYFMEETGFGE